MAFPLGWPPRSASGARNFRFYTGGTATANFSDNAFLFAEDNVAIAVIGGVDINGTVIASTTATGVTANDYTIEVVRPTTGHPVALSATLTGTDITVTLATIASGELNTSANTATLVAAAVNGLTGISAVANGTGNSSLTKEEVRKNFFGGGGVAAPTPVVSAGGASTVVRVGDRSAGGSPMGTGTQLNSPFDPYGPTPQMVFASTILIKNDDGTATNTVEYSFDGINVHGVVRGGETEILRGRREAGVAVRLGAGTPAFRIVAW